MRVRAQTINVIDNCCAEWLLSPIADDVPRAVNIMNECDVAIPATATWSTVVVAAQQHPPLRRVSRGTRVTDQQHQQSRMLFSAVVAPPTPTVAFQPSSSSPHEIADSCYSSCSEESHGSLSREPSDSLATELGVRLNSLLTIDDSPAYAHLLEFATKLGYSEAQLLSVLEKLGDAALGQDRVLTELIKLRKDQQQPTSKISSSNVDSNNATPTRQLRSIVIDGSNLAMT